MRAHELEESAVDDLKNRLPKLKDKSYNNIDRLMQHVCTRHKITGKKLHDMFVSKYGHTPDTWVNKIANRLGEEEVEEGKQKRKKKSKSSRAMGGYFFPGYAYFGGGDSGEGGGDGGGGESINHDMAEGEKEALQYATKAHAGQTRSGGDPYISHPVRVANHIRQYKQSHNLDALISAAYLHDTIEDTDTTQEVLHDLFGGLVASLVKELTSDPEQIKKMGKAQYLAHKMAAMSSYALVIKLADRLDNVKDITTAKTPEWRQKYAKETNHILDYIEKTRALSGTHQKLIELIRAKLAEINNPQQGVEEGTRERLSNKHDKIRKQSGLPDPKEYEKIIQQKKKEIADLKAQREQGVAEARASTASFRQGNTRRGELNAMSPEERKAHEDKRAEQQRKRDDARLERQRQQTAAKKGVKEGTIQKKSKMNEGVEGPEDIEKVKHFIKWSCKTLNMQKPFPRITLSKDTKKAQDGHHTGLHKGNDIWVYVANRNLIDIFRTIFHELTHHRQMQLNMIQDGDSYPGSPIEMLADMAAGKYIKIYGKDHPEMFQ
jgi:hypothetical protein